MATIFQNESAWSTTASTNANVDTGINWAEGQDAAAVNDSARGMMAARRKAALDQGGERVAGGTGDALTMTTNQVLTVPTHLVAGLRLAVRAIANNTVTAVTLAVDGSSPAPVKRCDGSALAAGSIRSGMMLDVVYNAGSSEWRAVNIPPVGTGFGGSSLGSFSAYSASGQNITNTSVNIIGIDTETYDIGAYFASPAWTPPAGTVFIIGTVGFSSVNAGLSIVAALYKNGSQVAQSQTVAGASAGITSVIVQYMGQVSGSDVFDLRAASSDPSYTISAGSAATYFMGTML